MAPLTTIGRQADVADEPGRSGLPEARPAGPRAADRSAAVPRPDRAVRSWPLLVLAAPAAAEVWSGWVGIAQKTGFGLVRPLPGIWPSLHLDTAITLPVGVEAYAAYALRAWLARDRGVSAGTRRFAKWSAIGSFALGMAGQVAYHLMAQAGLGRAPWVITTMVSCLPVLVLGMGTALAHMLRSDAAAAAEHRAGPPANQRSGAWSAGDRDGPERGQPQTGRVRAAGRQRAVPVPGSRQHHTAAEADRVVQARLDRARVIAHGCAAQGKQVSRRALRSGGIQGSNETLNALARVVSAELASAG